MARFLAGDVVFLPVPYVDTDSEKKRPALVLASWQYSDSFDYLLCPITTVPPKEASGLPLHATDFERGALPRPSYLRPYYLLAKAESAIAYAYGHLLEAKLNQVKDTIRGLID